MTAPTPKAAALHAITVAVLHNNQADYTNAVAYAHKRGYQETHIWDAYYMPVSLMTKGPSFDIDGEPIEDEPAPYTFDSYLKAYEQFYAARNANRPNPYADAELI